MLYLDQAVPDIAAIPTTAGTGSDGGKSAVISDIDGVKVVFGDLVGTGGCASGRLNLQYGSIYLHVIVAIAGNHPEQV